MADRERVAVTLQAPNGERGVLIGPADKVAALVRPEAVVDTNRFLESLHRAGEPDPSEAACRVCGCTEDRACPGGCWWVVDPAMQGDLCSQCVPAGPEAAVWTAGCTCGWRGASEDVEGHRCPLPDPWELLDCCEHPRERHYGQYGDGVPRCEFCDCSVKSW